MPPRCSVGMLCRTSSCVPTWPVYTTYTELAADRLTRKRTVYPQFFSMYNSNPYGAASALSNQQPGVPGSAGYSAGTDSTGTHLTRTIHLCACAAFSFAFATYRTHQREQTDVDDEMPSHPQRSLAPPMAVSVNRTPLIRSRACAYRNTRAVDYARELERRVFILVLPAGNV